MDYPEKIVVTGGGRDQALIDYWSTVGRNREVFLLNHGHLVAGFGRLLTGFERTWRQIAENQDEQGKSHVGLLVLTTLVERQVVLAFTSFVSHQSFVGWMLFRPALEALLMQGRWVDDPKRAVVWGKWRSNRKAYRQSFAGRYLRKSELPFAESFGAVLTELNDRFLHPNPAFTALGQHVAEADDHVELAMQFFDLDAAAHLAHCLAFLSLLELMWISSAEFIQSTLRILGAEDPPTREVPRRLEATRAEWLGEDLQYRAILDDLGLWGLGDAA